MPALLSIGQLIDHSWEHYRHKFVQLMSISGWLLVTTLIGVISLLLYPSASSLLVSSHHYTATETFAVVLWLVDSLVIAPVIATWIFISLIKLIHAQMLEKRVAIASLGRESWTLFWPAMLVNALVLLMLIAPWLLTLPGAFLLFLSHDPQSMSVNLGGILLVAGILAGMVLSVRWLVCYSYAPLALVLENRRGRAALDRSRELVTGRFWSAFVRMVLPKVVFVLIFAVAEGLLSQVLDVSIRSAVGLNADLYLRISGILDLVIGTAGAAILNPLLLTSDYLVYVSLKDTRGA